MGGFAIDPSAEPNIFPSNIGKRRILTLEGIELIFHFDPMLIPDLSEFEIQDKSKASGLAKTLVCLQALWFCIQCIVRAVNHMTISTLELNTFAHAVCTLLIYFLWWDKPLDIEEPTLIRGEAAHPVIALLSVFQAGFHTKAHLISDRYPSHGEFSEVPYVRKNADRVNVGFHNNPLHYNAEIPRTPSRLPTTLLRHSREIYDAELPLKPGFTRGYLKQKVAHGFYLTKIHNTKGFWQRVRKPAFSWLGTDDGGGCYLAVDLSPELVHCLKLAECAQKKLAECAHTELSTSWNFYTVHRIENIAFIGRLSKDTWSVIAGVTIAGIMYGGLHLTAWNALLGVNSFYWRVASVIVAVSGPSVALPLLLERYMTPFSRCDKPIFNIFEISTFILLVAVTIICIGARLCLVVLCFIELRSLPASTYIVPQWSQIFPHIS
jgi:hypothetical protein